MLMEGQVKFHSPQNFWNFTAKQCCSKKKKNWSELETCYTNLLNNRKKTNMKLLHTAHLTQYKKPTDPKLIWWYVFTPFFKLKSSAVRILVCTLSEVGARAQLLIKRVNNIFLNQTGIFWRLWLHWVSCMDPVYVVLVLGMFFTI